MYSSEMWILFQLNKLIFILIVWTFSDKSLGHIRSKNSFRPFFVCDLFQENVKDLMKLISLEFGNKKLFLFYFGTTSCFAVTFEEKILYKWHGSLYLKKTQRRQ